MVSNVWSGATFRHNVRRRRRFYFFRRFLKRGRVLERSGERKKKKSQRQLKRQRTKLSLNRAHRRVFETSTTTTTTTTATATTTTTTMKTIATTTTRTTTLFGAHGFGLVRVKKEGMKDGKFLQLWLCKETPAIALFALKLFSTPSLSLSLSLSR